MNGERRSLLALARISALRGVDCAAAFKRFGCARAALDAPIADLATVVGLGPRGALELAAARETALEAPGVEQLEASGIRLVGLGDPDYPELLSTISAPPVALFIRGDAGLMSRLSVAVVGARRATSYGVAISRQFGLELARAGVVVVSGLARGVDAAAHEGALEAGDGRTIAVLGCGPDIAYPAENRSLMNRIARQGLIVSEFPPGTAPLARNFPRRNRILSGLSRGTVVVEASARSGSLVTASLAADQGRDVFAVPGDVDRPLSQGTNALLRQGAIPARDAKDVLAEYGVTESKDSAEPGELTSEESLVLGLLELRGVHADWLEERAGSSVASLPLLLSNLVGRGLARRLPGNRYARAEGRWPGAGACAGRSPVSKGQPELEC